MAGVSGRSVEKIIKARGKARNASTKFLGIGRGQSGRKKGTGKKMKEKCERCLWNWENVHTGVGTCIRVRGVCATTISRLGITRRLAVWLVPTLSIGWEKVVPNERLQDADER